MLMVLELNDIDRIIKWIEDYYFQKSKSLNLYTPKTYIGTNENKISIFKSISNILNEQYNIKFNVYHKFENLFKDSDIYSTGIKSKESSIHDTCYLQKNKYDISSLDVIKVRFPKIKERIKVDKELFIQLIIQTYKSKIDRIMMLGGVNWDWVVLDNLLFNGFEKYENCISSKNIHELEYGMLFFTHSGHIGSVLRDGYAVPYATLPEFEIRTKFWNDIKIKNKSYNLYDIILDSWIDLPQDIKHSIKVKTDKLTKKCNLIELDQLHGENAGFPIISFHEINPNTNFYNNNKILRINGKFDFDIDVILSDWRLQTEYLKTFYHPENHLRKELNLPQIGEGWVSETNLYFEIKKYYSNTVVVNHARPNWLGKQHLDIYFPEYNIAIEYQGEQHFAPVGYFGGNDAYLKNRERDERKKELCKTNKCHLIYVEKGYVLETILNNINALIN